MKSNTSAINFSALNLKIKNIIFALNSKSIQLFSINCAIILCFISGLTAVYSQTVYQPYNFTANQPNNNYMANSTAFRQEIARMAINVVRDGKNTLPITEVPRLAKNDVLKVRLLEELVNGVKPDQSNFDWTFLVAFINPGRNTDTENTVSEEIQFKKSGWYKEYTVTVPYDSQPIFFLYTKPKYRAKILNLITKNQEDIRKIGEKTIELSGAYAKIGSFLNELQYVVNRSQYNNTYSGYNTYNTYRSYGSYGTGSGLNQNLLVEQSVERLARSFNIQLPSCWGGSYGNYNNGYNNNTYNGYNNGSNVYNNYNSGYNSYNNYNSYGLGNDFMGRVQCVAKSVRLEDLDISVSRLLQQGGILAAAQLSQKYPQIAYWINIAAVALDIILKLTRKSPLKIVPTVISTNGNQGQAVAYQQNPGYQANFAVNQGIPPNPAFASTKADSVKISLFAESPPTDNGFVTAYPLVINKWQANSDPDVISLPTPALTDQCLHAGQNVLRSTDLMTDWMGDAFTKDFELVISSPNGFRKEFPLKKNVGLNGWELNLTKEDLNSFPKINMTMESVITGMRGFNEIKSPKFDLPIPVGNSWEIVAASQKAFAAGGKRIITLRNQLGSCKCLQSVVYKPSFGGEFVFEAGSRENGLMYSMDGKEVSFEVDTKNFQPGQGKLELRQYGGDLTNLDVNLYPAPPQINDLKMARGDTRAILYGVRLDQLKAVVINGKRAVVVERKNSAANIDQKANPGVPQENVSVNAQNPAAAGVAVTEPQSEVTVAFENPGFRQDSNNISLELELVGDRIIPYPTTFNVSLARPLIVTNEVSEVEGTAIKIGFVSPVNLDNLPVFPIETTAVSLIVQNALTDYDFKAENIQIETRIENAQINQGDLPEANFEVLDWKNIKISFPIYERLKKLIGGRRLQFRLRSRERGDSDWITIKQTFARLPNISTVKCSNENCEMSGEGIEYISQVSVDGGKTWNPEAPATLMAQPTSDDKKIVIIPNYTNKNLLRIRLRDFPSIEGLTVMNYNLSRTSGRKIK